MPTPGALRDVTQQAHTHTRARFQPPHCPRLPAARQVRCVVITGTGQSFCAGANFRSASGAQAGVADAPPPERSFAIYEPFLSVLTLEVPVLAAMNGHAIGGGLGLALVADIRVAHATSKYGANFTRLGLHPGMATTYILPRLVGLPRAMELLLTGAWECEEYGRLARWLCLISSGIELCGPRAVVRLLRSASRSRPSPVVTHGVMGPCLCTVARRSSVVRKQKPRVRFPSTSWYFACLAP
jgi:hypothetical protein